MNINESLDKIVKSLREDAGHKFDIDSPDFSDEETFEEEVDFGEGPVTRDGEFTNDSESYIWEKPFSDIKEDSESRIQVWSAINTITDDTLYFVVDIDTSYIYAGPFDEVETAKDSLNDKQFDTNKSDDESFDTIKKNGVIWKVIEQQDDLLLLKSDVAAYQPYAVVTIGEDTTDWVAKKYFYDLDDAREFFESEATKANDDDEIIDEVPIEESLNEAVENEIELIDEEPAALIDEEEDIIDEPESQLGCVVDTATRVMESYQNANKWMDILKEFLFTDMGCPFFASYIHNLAHTMPVRFDKFGDILHTIDMKIPYPATQYIPQEPSGIDDVFNLTFMILDAIKTALNDFIKCTDENYHGMSCAAETLLNDIEGEYVPLYKMRKAWTEYQEPMRFDRWVGTYAEKRADLNESLDESVVNVEPQADINNVARESSSYIDADALDRFPNRSVVNVESEGLPAKPGTIGYVCWAGGDFYPAGLYVYNDNDSKQEDFLNSIQQIKNYQIKPGDKAYASHSYPGELPLYFSSKNQVIDFVEAVNKKFDLDWSYYENPIDIYKYMTANEDDYDIDFEVKTEQSQDYSKKVPSVEQIFSKIPSGYNFAGQRILDVYNKYNESLNETNDQGERTLVWYDLSQNPCKQTKTFADNEEYAAFTNKLHDSMHKHGFFTTDGVVAYREIQNGRATYGEEHPAFHAVMELNKLRKGEPFSITNYASSITNNELSKAIAEKIFNISPEEFQQLLNKAQQVYYKDQENKRHGYNSNPYKDTVKKQGPFEPEYSGNLKNYDNYAESLDEAGQEQDTQAIQLLADFCDEKNEELGPDDHGYMPCKVTSDYSGRFMYGKLCYGIVCPASLRDDLVIYLASNGRKDLVKDMRADNMGLNMIYYFPSIVGESKFEVESLNEAQNSWRYETQEQTAEVVINNEFSALDAEDVELYFNKAISDERDFQDCDIELDVNEESDEDGEFLIVNITVKSNIESRDIPATLDSPKDTEYRSMEPLDEETFKSDIKRICEDAGFDYDIESVSSKITEADYEDYEDYDEFNESLNERYRADFNEVATIHISTIPTNAINTVDKLEAEVESTLFDFYTKYYTNIEIDSEESDDEFYTEIVLTTFMSPDGNGAPDEKEIRKKLDALNDEYALNMEILDLTIEEEAIDESLNETRSINTMNALVPDESLNEAVVEQEPDVWDYVYKPDIDWICDNYDLTYDYNYYEPQDEANPNDFGAFTFVFRTKSGDPYPEAAIKDLSGIGSFDDVYDDIYDDGDDSQANADAIYATRFISELVEKLDEDTVKTKDGKWTNKGNEGTHGKFRTKKEADAQRRAMFANNFHEALRRDQWKELNIEDYEDSDLITTVLTDRRLTPLDNEKQRQILLDNNIHIESYCLNGVIVEGRLRDILNACKQLQISSPTKVFI